MKVKWLGHAAFMITSDDGVKIVTDPYEKGTFGVDYDSIEEAADIVVVSHDHPDHNNIAGVPGNPQVVKGAGSHQAKGIDFSGTACHHDESGGGERGDNTIFCFTVSGVRLCHLGDLGHTLSDKQAAAIGEVDVLLIPVGGSFTVDADGASQVIQQLKPKVAIPMHYRTDKCPNFPVSDVEPFLAGKAGVKRMDAAEAEFSAGQLPSPTEIVVLQHAL